MEMTLIFQRASKQLNETNGYKLARPPVPCHVTGKTGHVTMRLKKEWRFPKTTATDKKQEDGRAARLMPRQR